MHKRYLICFLGSNILLQSGYLAPKIISLYAFTITKQRLLYGAFNKHWKEPVNRHKKEGTTDRKYFLNKVGMERIP